LPEEFHPRDGADLWQGIGNLWPKFLPYFLSFTVLGLRWIASIEIRSNLRIAMWGLALNFVQPVIARWGRR